MNYSLPFYVGNPYLDTVDELSIKYDAENEQSLTNFLDKHTHQRIVLKIAKENKLTEKNYLFLGQIVKMYAAGSVVCRFDSLNLSAAQQALPHFFNYYCYDIEQVQTFNTLGVTDIYITGNLCFQLPQIKKQFNNCNIRVFPNVAQSSMLETDNRKKFFIRPEDVSLFEGYVDYLEFYTPDVRQAAALYKIYKVQKRYSSWLSDIVTNAPKNIHNDCLTSVLAEERVHCNKACVYYGRKCAICESCFNLAETLYTKQHTIVLNQIDTENNEN